MGQVVNFPFVGVLNNASDAAFQVVRRNAADDGYEWATAAWLDVANTFTVGQTVALAANGAGLTVQAAPSGQVDPLFELKDAGGTTRLSFSLSDYTLQVGSTFIQLNAMTVSAGYNLRANSFDDWSITQAVSQAIFSTHIPVRARGVSGQTGPLVQLQGQSSTTVGRPQADVDAVWNSIDGAAGTDATRASDLIFRAYTVTTAQEGVRVRAAAAGVRIGVYGATPVAQQVLATGTGATVDDVIQMLQNIGWCKQS